MQPALPSAPLQPILLSTAAAARCRAHSLPFFHVAECAIGKTTTRQLSSLQRFGSLHICVRLLSRMYAQSRRRALFCVSMVQYIRLSAVCVLRIRFIRSFSDQENHRPTSTSTRIVMCWSHATGKTLTHSARTGLNTVY